MCVQREETLEDANNEFIAAYAQRTAEKAEGNMGVTLRLRDEMYDIYLQMIYTVQYLANSTDEANAEKATACQAFIAHVNVLLSDAKKRLEQRLSGGDAEGEGSNEGGNSSSATDSTDSSDSGGSGSGSGDGHTDTTEPTDNGGSNNPSNPSNPSNSSNPSEGGNSSDPNKPSEGGVVNGDEVSF